MSMCSKNHSAYMKFNMLSITAYFFISESQGELVTDCQFSNLVILDLYGDNFILKYTHDWVFEA